MVYTYLLLHEIIRGYLTLKPLLIVMFCAYIRQVPIAHIQIQINSRNKRYFTKILYIIPLSNYVFLQTNSEESVRQKNVDLLLLRVD